MHSISGIGANPFDECCAGNPNGFPAGHPHDWQVSFLHEAVRECPRAPDEFRNLPALQQERFDFSSSLVFVHGLSPGLNGIQMYFDAQ